eukprot:gene9966-6958_t
MPFFTYPFSTPCSMPLRCSALGVEGREEGNKYFVPTRLLRSFNNFFGFTLHYYYYIAILLPSFSLSS